MANIRFEIPCNRDELCLHTGEDKYTVQEIQPFRMIPSSLDECRKALSKDGACFILEHFDTFFSILVHNKKLELSLVTKGFDRLLSGIENLVNSLERIIERNGSFQDEEKAQYVNVCKMYAYLLSSMSAVMDEKVSKGDDIVVDKRKKKAARSDEEDRWDEVKLRLFQYIYRWVQVPLHTLWQPDFIEDVFLTTLAQVCYKNLENCKDASTKPTRQAIFGILGTLVKRYSHGMSFVIRIIQTIEMCDALAVPLAEGVIQMTTECGCTGLIAEILNEIEEKEFDGTTGKNMATFLTKISSKDPKALIPVIDDITDFFTKDHYGMRTCAVEIIGNIIESVLHDSPQVQLTREQMKLHKELVQSLMDHLYDANSIVRSKVLQTLLNLVCEEKIAQEYLEKLLERSIERLSDKSSVVRKHSLQLIRALIQNNPNHGLLIKSEVEIKNKVESRILNELEVKVLRGSEPGDEIRDEFLQDEIVDKLEDVIVKFVQNADEIENDENINFDRTIESVRELMMEKKFEEAVRLYLISIKASQPDFDLQTLPQEESVKTIFVTMVKIFMEKENHEPMDRKEYKVLENDLKTQKLIANVLQRTLSFIQVMEDNQLVPKVKNLLFSTTTSDAIEAAALLGIAEKFGISDTSSGVQLALFQVLHKDESIKNNVTEVYKESLFGKDDDRKKITPREKAIREVTRLIGKLKAMQPGQSPALASMIASWKENNTIGNEHFKVMWELYAMKRTNATSLDSRAALMILTMIGEKEPNVLMENIEVLTEVGLGPRGKEDLLLARDTCKALLQFRETSGSVDKTPLRYENDHKIFNELSTILVNSFFVEVENGYNSFSREAINVVYHLANQPDHIARDVIVKILDKVNELKMENLDEDFSIPFFEKRFAFLLGHIAMKQMIYLDTSVYKELKRRNALTKLAKTNMRNRDSVSSVSSVALHTSMRKSLAATTTASAKKRRRKDNSNEENGEESLEGASADDVDAEVITETLENKITMGDGFLAQFFDWIIEICQHPEVYEDEEVQASAVLCMIKYMTVSSKTCEERIQLLVTILERSTYPSVKENILIGLADLTTRFPNSIEPWSSHLYARLRDTDVSVRTTCVQTLSNLIMREMIRVKGQVSELALCMVDENAEISKMSRHLFQDLAKKGNALYNVILDIFSKLTDPKLELEERKFQEIFKIILGLIDKEKQVETIVEKLCLRLKLAKEERTCSDLAYCLSLLQYSAKCIRRLTEHVPLLKDQIHQQSVLKAFNDITERAKKKPELKQPCLDLQEKINEVLENCEDMNTSGNLMPPPMGRPARRADKNNRKKKKQKSSSSDDSDSDSDNGRSQRAKAAAQAKKNQGRRGKRKDSSDSDSEEEAAPRSRVGRTPSSQAKRQKGKQVVRRRKDSSDSDSEEEAPRKSAKTPSKKKTARKNPSPPSPVPANKKRRSNPDSDSTPTRTTRRSSRSSR